MLALPGHTSEQRTGKNQKPPLDRKSPIQVRIHPPPGESHVRTRRSPTSYVKPPDRVSSETGPSAASSDDWPDPGPTATLSRHGARGKARQVDGAFTIPPPA